MQSPTSKPTKSSKQRNASTPSPNKLLGYSYTTVLLLVVLFFVGGIYLGSLVVSEKITVAAPTMGLPGTNNVFVTWAESEIETLEKSIAANLHRDLPVPSTQSNLKSTPKVEIKPVSSYLRKQEAKPLSSVTTPPQPKINKLPPPVVSEIAPASDSSEIKDKSYSLLADEHSYMQAPTSVDNDNILVAAWIFLEDTASDNNMRTVFSNKNAGCESGNGQNGISMYVNAWESSDHKIYLEYGGSSSGCHKLDSGAYQLEIQKWYHVAAFFGKNDVAIFLDGAMISHETIDDPHIVQTTNHLLFGHYGPSSYALYGNISDVFIYHSPSSGFDETTFTKVVTGVKDGYDENDPILSAGLFAHYPLHDAVPRKMNKNCQEELHALNGKYVFPPKGGKFAGVDIVLVDGTDGEDITETMKTASDKLGRERREKIKEGMQHAWNGYKQYAWGMDELKPVSNKGSNNWGGMGMTLVDSLDTLWLMGMKTEFEEAKQWVKTSLNYDRAGTVSVFEVTIRELGGLLAAYDLSGDKIFLEKAQDLGSRLIHAFGTRSGIPTSMINLRNGQAANGWSGNSAILSELGTLQIEFRYLAEQVHEKSYEENAMKPLRLMASKNPPYGLYPIKVSISNGDFAENMVTFGALGDSFYEYLLKVWLQGGRKEKWLREAYDRAMDGAISKLLQASSPSGLAFLSDWNGNNNIRKMDHLVCFMPGLLALGAYTDPNGGIESPRAQRDLKVAKALMYTCREMYHRMNTGISAEYVEFPPGRDLVPGPNVGFYILRPETAESLFILNQLTGDPIYREWAWEIWESIDKACKTNSGYASLRNVNNAHAGVDDRMESFFLAETIKYLYLAQDPDHPIDLMKYVFNTEAHPTKIFGDAHVPIPK